MRTCSVPSQIALGVSLFCGISFWPVTSSLVNFYQACDGMFYPVCAVMMILTLRHNRFSLLIVSLMAILIRQQAFVLAILSFVHLYLKTKDRKSLIYIGFIVVGFGLLTHYAGTAGAQNLAKHTVFRIFDIASAARGVIQTKLPIMFSPFLLLLICYFKRTYRYMLRYWWATLFAMITILQPLLSFDITGVFDAQRLIMMGVWPFFILAGLLLRDTLKSRWAKWTFLILPLLYGTEHLNILKHAYPTVLGHRIIMNGIILALILLDLYYRRQSRRGAS